MELKCHDLTKRYFMKTAVDHIGLSLKEGHIYALLGPNGSGKSTLMKMISGLTSPSKGTITIDGRPVSWKTKAKTAYAPTEPYFFSYMTIRDAAGYYEDFFEDFDRASFKEILKEMGLQEEMKISSLSSGMTAKAKIALTLARNAELILLDEPLNGIDLMAREEILKSMIRFMPEHGSVVISSHMVEELESIVDHAIYMKDGAIAADIDVEQLREEKELSVTELYREIYQGEVE